MSKADHVATAEETKADPPAAGAGGVLRVRKLPSVGTVVPEPNEELGRVYAPVTSNQAFYDAVTPSASMIADGHAIAAAGISYARDLRGRGVWHVRLDSVFDFGFWAEFDFPELSGTTSDVHTYLSVRHGRVLDSNGSPGSKQPEWRIAITGDLEQFSIRSNSYAYLALTCVVPAATRLAAKALARALSKRPF